MTTLDSEMADLARRTIAIQHARIEALEKRNAALATELEQLRQHIFVAAQWCPDGCCEFKHLKSSAPPVEDFEKNFLKWVERQG